MAGSETAPESSAPRGPAVPDAPDTPDAAAEPSGPGAPAGPERRGFPWVQLVLGLILAAAAVALVFWRPVPDELEISGRVEPAEPSAGTVARLSLRLRPGPAAPAGAKLCSGARVAVESPKELAFERATEYFLHPDEELVMHFRVAPLAAPGPRKLKLFAAAELDVGGARRRARLEREFTITVGFPPPEDKGGQ